MARCVSEYRDLVSESASTLRVGPIWRLPGRWMQHSVEWPEQRWRVLNADDYQATMDWRDSDAPL